MKMKKNYDLCDGVLKDGGRCPLTNYCERFRGELDKTKTLHLAWGPYHPQKNTCGHQIPFEGWQDYAK
jgi:hypothetical protein